MLGSCASCSFSAASRSAATFKSTATFSARRAASSASKPSSKSAKPASKFQRSFLRLKVKVKFLVTGCRILFAGSASAAILASSMDGAAVVCSAAG
jgi:hypothetical protein